jgi:hypothetical protein
MNTVLEQELEKLKCMGSKDQLTSEGCIYFICKYLYVYEPRVTYEKGIKPFLLFEKQKEYIQFLEKNYRLGKGVTVEKSRDMGATYCSLAWIFWHWLFDQEFSAFLLSLREDEVKKLSGNFNPLFSKIDLFLTRLPPFLIPKGFQYEKHSLQMSLINPSNNCSIRGSSLTDNAGRSNRESVVLLDEWEFYGTGREEIPSNCRQTTPNVVQVSTVNGRYGVEEIERAKNNNELFIMNWWDNPFHDEAWYNTQRATMLPYVFKREIERDREASPSGMVYDNINECPIVELPYNPDFPLYCSWDFGYHDQTVILWIQVNPETGDIFVIDEFSKNLKLTDYYLPFVTGKIPLGNTHHYTAEDKAIIKEHAGWLPPKRHFGDATSAKMTEQNTGTSRFDILKQEGIIVVCNEALWRNRYRRTEITRNTLPRVTISTKCKNFLHSMRNYRYKDTATTLTTEEQARQISHDQSDACTAFEAFCVSLSFLQRDLNAGKKPKTPRINPFRMRNIA